MRPDDLMGVPVSNVVTINLVGTLSAYHVTVHDGPNVELNIDLTEIDYVINELTRAKTVLTAIKAFDDGEELTLMS